jgi:hypothetical protein
MIFIFLPGWSGRNIYGIPMAVIAGFRMEYTLQCRARCLIVSPNTCQNNWLVFMNIRRKVVAVYTPASTILHGRGGISAAHHKKM